MLKVGKEPKVPIQVPKELKGQHLKVHRALKVRQQELKDFKEVKEHKVFKELKGRQQGLKELKETQDFLDQQVLKVVYKVLKVP